MSRWARNPGLSITEVDGEIFLIDQAGNEIYYLDVIGSGVWRAMSSPVSTEDLIDLLGNAFPEVPAVQLQTEIPSLLEDMLREGVVIRQPE